MAHGPTRCRRAASRVARRATVARLVRSAGWALCVGAAAGLAIIGAGKIAGLNIDPVLSLAAPLGVGLFGAAAWTWRKRPTRTDAAQRIDQSHGWHDRVSNAMLLDPARGEFASWAVEEGESIAAQARAAKAAPIRVGWAWPAGTVLAAGALALGLWAPAIGWRTPAPRIDPADVAGAAEAIGDAARTLAPEARRTQTAPLATAEDRRRLDEIERELAQGGITPDEARMKAAEVARDLAERAQAEAEQIERSQQMLADALREASPQNEADADVERLGRALAERDWAGAEEASEAIENRLGSASPQERESLTRSLERLAESIPPVPPGETTTEGRGEGDQAETDQRGKSPADTGAGATRPPTEGRAPGESAKPDDPESSHDADPGLPGGEPPTGLDEPGPAGADRPPAQPSPQSPGTSAQEHEQPGTRPELTPPTNAPPQGSGSQESERPGTDPKGSGPPGARQPQPRQPDPAGAPANEANDNSPGPGKPEDAARGPDSNTPSRDELAREFREGGMSDEQAQQAADRELEARRDAKARQDAARQAERLREAIRDTAKDPREGAPSNEPQPGSETPQNPSRAGDQSEPVQPERGRPDTSPRPSAEPQRAPAPGSQTQGEPKQGESQPQSSGAQPNPGAQPRPGESPQPGARPGAEPTAGGTPRPDQTSPPQPGTPPDESKAEGTRPSEGTPQQGSPAPDGTPSPRAPEPGDERKAGEDRGPGQGSDGGERAPGRLREEIRRLRDADQRASDLRNRQRQAEDTARELLGEAPDDTFDPVPPSGLPPGDGGDRPLGPRPGSSMEDVESRAQGPEVRPDNPGGPRGTERVLAEWESDRAGERAGTSSPTLIEGVRQAAQGAERAIEQRGVPTRYGDFLRRVYQRLEQRTGADAPKGDGES